jgi:hypothetical protein
MELNVYEIRVLEGKGFNRWQKNDLDRLYINAANLGLVCQYYKTGNVRDAWFGGASISNCEARRMKMAKTFVDVKTGTVYSDNPLLKEAAEQIVEEARRDAQ